MSKIRHSKYKNTGLLFELLVHQITADTLKNIESPSISLMKKYFIKTELGKEYKIYEGLMKPQNLNETRSSFLLNESLENSKKLNKKSIKRLKYNLIKEISENYNIDEFFSSKIKNYKQLASLYILIESTNSPEITDADYITANKMTILEHVTRGETKVEKEVNNLNEISEDKDLRILTYKILLENFNKKYDGLNPNQKVVLKEFINNMDSSKGLKEMYNSNIRKIHTLLDKEIPKISDKATSIKITEMKNIVHEIDKTKKVSNDDITNLLQYYNLTEELKRANSEVL